MTRQPASSAQHLGLVDATWPVVAGLLFALSAYVVLERTYLTWSRGSQLVGYSIAHSTAALLLVGSVLLVAVWVGAATVHISYVWRKTRRIPRKQALRILLIATMVGLPLTPYGWLENPFIALAGPGRNGPNLLIAAAANGDNLGVHLLLHQGVPLDGRDPESGWNVLLAASAGNDVALVRWLIQRGARPNEADDFGMTPLMIAVELGHADVARELLKFGADPRATSGEGKTVFAIAEERGHAECIKVIRDALNR